MYEGFNLYWSQIFFNGVNPCKSSSMFWATDANISSTLLAIFPEIILLFE
jgi:hypothetical protein